MRIEHQRMHEKHKGHEAMHLEMMLVLLLTLFVAQVFLVQWKKRHFKSYQTVTLLGMWMIPVIFCIKLGWWRFIYIWIVWSVVNAYISYKATRKLLPGTTPRLVYRWFNFIYKISYGLGLAGYMIMMATVFGLNLLLLIRPEKCFDVGLLLIFYGLYYGVLGRDFAEICSESMASHIGYYTKSGLPGKALDVNICAICGNQMSIPYEEDDVSEKIFELTCHHR
ncbi:hypothetical protein BSL78_17756 [Apostichopus japonicus]|uniref:RING finger protein n=2 Tax=Stichopus japonicus TaxID=307972 RepID=A0A2G8KBI9_STIJA|nr:hypothetical protein BSL78_17756 [Apostichopus japonicus]